MRSGAARARERRGAMTGRQMQSIKAYCASRRCRSSCCIHTPASRYWYAHSRERNGSRVASKDLPAL